MISAHASLAYWSNPPEPWNSPREYAQHTKRSDFLMSILPNYVSKDESVLELGCNCGRNLNALYNAGYKKLSGIDVSHNALLYGSLMYSELHGEAVFYNDLIESWIKTAPDYDCIFTMAVLEHIVTESEWIFEYIAQKARRTIITIEDEVSKTSGHFPRDYKAIFEGMGWKQILEKQATTQDDLKGFVARVFEREK